MEEEIELCTKLIHPFSMLVIGSSSSGKTTFFYDLIKYYKHLIAGDIEGIIFVYAIWQDEFNEFLDKVNFVKDWNSPLLQPDFMSQHRNRLILVDDAGRTAPPKYLLDFFIKYSHHYKYSICLQCHSPFDTSIADLRLISQNSHYSLFCSSKRARDAVMIFAHQVFRNQHDWLNTFKDLLQYTANIKFARFLVDTHPHQTCQRATLRMNLFYPHKGDEPLSIFFPK